MVENMAVSKTIEIHSMTMEMKKSGQTVYSLCVGEPDYQPPDAVLKATGETACAGNTKYTSVNGDAKLRASIAADLKRRKGLDYSADQIVVSNGAKQSVIQALLSTVGPGDDVIIPAPYWPSYPGGPTAPPCTTPHQHPTQLTRPDSQLKLHPGTVNTSPGTFIPDLSQLTRRDLQPLAPLAAQTW